MLCSLHPSLYPSCIKELMFTVNSCSLEVRNVPDKRRFQHLAATTSLRPKKRNNTDQRNLVFLLCHCCFELHALVSAATCTRAKVSLRPPRWTGSCDLSTNVTVTGDANHHITGPTVRYGKIILASKVVTDLHSLIHEVHLNTVIMNHLGPLKWT